MFKDDKNYITDADIKKQLEFENKANTLYLIIIFPMFLLCLALFIGFGSSAIRNIPNGIDGEFFGKLMLSLLGLAFVVFSVWRLIITARSIIKTKNSSFTVVKDKLVRLEERTVNSGRHVSVINIFHFRDYGEYQVTAKDGSAFSYSSEDDIFYLVFFEGSAHPALAYNSKIYDYRKNP